MEEQKQPQQTEQKEKQITREELLKARQQGILNDNGINILINDLLRENIQLKQALNQQKQTEPEVIEPNKK